MCHMVLKFGLVIFSLSKPASCKGLDLFKSVYRLSYPCLRCVLLCRQILCLFACELVLHDQDLSSQNWLTVTPSANEES